MPSFPSFIHHRRLTDCLYDRHEQASPLCQELEEKHFGTIRAIRKGRRTWKAAKNAETALIVSVASLPSLSVSLLCPEGAPSTVTNCVTTMIDSTQRENIEPSSARRLHRGLGCRMRQRKFRICRQEDEQRIMDHKHSSGYQTTDRRE